MKTWILVLWALAQSQPCPTNDYPVKFTVCADPALCDLENSSTEREPDLLADWSESCQLYALLPIGWDHRTPARGLLMVGKLFPNDGLSWGGRNGGRYETRQALEEGRLGPTVLAVATESSLWGCGSDQKSRLDPIALESVGVCIDATGAVVGNPWWRVALSHMNRGAHSLLRLCEGGREAVYGRFGSQGHGLDEGAWSETGVLAEQILPRLRRLPGHELVCISDELAAARRWSSTPAQPSVEN